MFSAHPLNIACRDPNKWGVAGGGGGGAASGYRQGKHDVGILLTAPSQLFILNTYLDSGLSNVPHFWGDS